MNWQSVVYNFKNVNLFFQRSSPKIAGKKYIWQKASLEGVNLICFFAEKQIKFTDKFIHCTKVVDSSRPYYTVASCDPVI